jgi:hypothetical protein
VGDEEGVERIGALALKMRDVRFEETALVVRRKGRVIETGIRLEELDRDVPADLRRHQNLLDKA